MSFLFTFPPNAAFGKALPKGKIYEHASPSASVRELFIREVDKITWSYKLSPDTINLPAKDGVQEVQVFNLALKAKSLSQAVLTTIDKTIPSPIFFVQSFEEQMRYVATYKRPNEADKSKWVVSSYFESDWMTPDTESRPLPLALDMGSLYHQLLKQLIPLQAREGESMEALVERCERLKKLEREVERTQSRLNGEKQFNRKVEINAELRKFKLELEEMAR